ncbi:unnamed protein product [Vicia faba]|uniref:Uncharacterized protein n=1 Tax=Vicia faba TaxID=3906 RepID=A0AAV0YJ25_VICFA|nr:unnamed protein product [Vicia faba]
MILLHMSSITLLQKTPEKSFSRFEIPLNLRKKVRRRARQKKGGEYTSKSTQEVAEKIDSLVQEAEKGAIVPDGRNDILSLAIGTSEHGEEEDIRCFREKDVQYELQQQCLGVPNILDVMVLTLTGTVYLKLPKA